MVYLHERVLQDLDLDLLEHIPHLTRILEHGALLGKDLTEVLAHRRLDQYRLVEVRVALRRVVERGAEAHRALFEHTQRMALLHQLVHVTPRERPLQQKHHVLNHVLDRNEVHE